MQNKDNIPSSLAELKQWLPYIGGKHAATGWNTPDNWQELDEIQGEAIFCSTGTEYLVIDGDHIIDNKGVMYPHIREDLNRIIRRSGKTYTERSMSGRGIHGVYDLSEYAGTFPKMSPQRIRYPEYRYEENGKEIIPTIEIWYKAAHLFFLTGDIYEGFPDTIAGGDEAAAAMREIQKLLEERTGPDGKQASNALRLPEKIENGERNSTLFRLASSLQAKGLPDAAIRDAVSTTNAEMCKDPLTDKELDTLVNSALRYEKGEITGNESRSGKSKDPVELLSMEDVEEKEITWLIPCWIPEQAVTIIGGDGGAGKTTLWCDLAAKISAGKTTLLDQAKAFRDPATVLFFSSEDSADTVLLKKLRKAGGLKKNIFTLDLSHERFNDIVFENGGLLEELVKAKRPKLLIFDPVQQYIPQTVKMAERNAMRRCLAPLKRLCEVYGCTILLVVHTNKRDGASGRKRLADSTDLWDFARSVLMLGKTKEPGVRYISQEKNSYARESKTILYKITDNGIEYAGTTSKKESDFIREQFVQKGDSPQRQNAKECIRDALEAGDVEAAELKKSVCAAGVSSNAYTVALKQMVNEKAVHRKVISGGKKGGTKWLYGLEPPANFDLTNLELPEAEVPEEWQEE